MSFLGYYALFHTYVTNGSTMAKVLSHNLLLPVLTSAFTIACIAVLPLTCYHSFLLTVGQTTAERVRKVYGSNTSPYFQSIFHSVWRVCCMRQSESLVGNQAEILSPRVLLTEVLQSYEDGQYYQSSNNSV
jgi:hypothetical protein